MRDTLYKEILLERIKEIGDEARDALNRVEELNKNKPGMEQIAKMHGILWAALKIVCIQCDTTVEVMMEGVNNLKGGKGNVKL